MKKYIYTVIAASCAMFASCSQESEFASQSATPQGKAITEISASSGVESRAVVDGTKINWESGDALKVFGIDGSSAAANADYTLSSDAGSTSGKFTNESSTVSTIQACMYPAQTTATWDNTNSKLTCNIPTVQTATAGSFYKDAAIMYYIGDKTAVTLNSAVAFLKVTLGSTETNVHAITVYSSTALSGNVDITSSGVVAASTGSETYVTLQADADNGALAADKSYYIAILSGIYGKLSIAYKYTDHTAKAKEASSELGNLQAGHVKSIGVNFSTGTVRDAVQLWENGPYFATINIGQTVTDYSTITTAFDSANPGTLYSVANVGGLYTWGKTNESREGTYVNEYNTGITVLTGDDDTATKLWGSAWRMPTQAELNSLKDGLSSGTGTGTTNDLVWSWCNGTSSHYIGSCTLAGYKISGKAGSAWKDNSVFFPAAGYCDSSYSKVDGQGDHGDYWSSTPDGSDDAYELSFDSFSQLVNNYYRDYGYSVRAVLK